MINYTSCSIIYYYYYYLNNTYLFELILKEIYPKLLRYISTYLIPHIIRSSLLYGAIYNRKRSSLI